MPSYNFTYQQISIFGSLKELYRNSKNGPARAA